MCIYIYIYLDIPIIPVKTYLTTLNDNFCIDLGALLIFYKRFV